MLILAAPVMVVALTGLTLIFVLLRQMKWGLLTGLMALSLNAWTEQIPVRMKRDVPQVKPAGTLRVLEYNICGKVEFAPIHDSTFVDYVRKMDADVLFLPENSLGCCFGLEEMLKNEYPYSVHDYDRFMKICDGTADCTLYSRFPLTDFQSFRVSREALQKKFPFMDPEVLKVQAEDILAFLATADVDGQPVSFLHVHLRTNGYDDAKAEGNGKRQKVHNIYDNLRFGYAFRSAEADTLAHALSNCPNPLIICGDFNDINGSYCVRTLQNCRKENTHQEYRDRLRDAWWNGGQGFGFTFAAQHLLLRLDHILYSKEFELQAVSVPKVQYSDHRPLVADFCLRK